MQLGDLAGSCQSNPTFRSIVIQITDQCPQCEPDHLDVQALTWAKVRSVALYTRWMKRVRQVRGRAPDHACHRLRAEHF